MIYIKNFRINNMDISSYEALIQEIEDLKQEARGCAVIVEGIRDEEALRHIGVEASFYRVGDKGVTILEICERIRDEHTQAFIFVDIDRAGEKIARKLRGYLSQLGVRINEKYRRSILRKLETEQVENIPVRLRRIESELYKSMLYRWK